MKFRIYKFSFLLFFAIVVLFPVSGVGAEDFIGLAQKEWFDRGSVPVVGIEYELYNLPQAKVSKILHNLLGGEVTTKPRATVFMDKNGNEVKWETVIFKHKETKIGSFRVELDDNGVSMENFDPNTAVVEIVTAPLGYEQTLLFEEALLMLKKRGAKGADDSHPVALQLNIQIGDGVNSESVDINNVLKFLRNYLKRTHRPAIESFLNVADSRRVYMGLFTQGMMKKILDPRYHPSQQEFYDDFMYRQSAELFDDELAWVRNLNDVKNNVKAHLQKNGFEVLLPIMKWNHVRVSSLLMFLNPEDWMSQFLLKTYWFKPYPVLEIREPNGDFRLMEIYSTVLGIFQGSEKQGDISILERQGGLLTADIQRLKEEEVNASGKAWVVRTYPYNGKTDPYIDPETNYYQQIYRVRNSTLVNVNGNYSGSEPYLVGGESIVFHNLPDFQKTIIGKYNPGLSNEFIGRFIEHKYREFLFWEQYAPGSMPRSISLDSIYKDGESISDLKERLNARFPEGWVLKGAYESATQEDYIITEKDDLAKGLKIYSQQFEDFQRARDEAFKESAGGNPDILVRRTREHPAFLGWRLKRYLKRPQNAIVQSKMQIESEYRVEVIAGKVLGGESTIPRYQYSIPGDEDWRNDVEIHKVENFAQNIVDRLPKQMRAIPFALDVAVLSDGSTKLVESNPMSNSGFLAYDKRGIKALNKFLIKYPQLLKSGEVTDGYSPQEQLMFIYQFSNQHEIKGIEKENTIKDLLNRIEERGGLSCATPLEGIK